uniref:Methyltransferase domain-containing protein n=1 Tax=viral metagenome TaxID=1070528 RepID=A0A6C0DQM4_9ZZZZ
METYFTNVYENSIWGNNNNYEYNGSSGGGSDIDYNKDVYIPFLKNFIVNNNIKHIVDLGCGDFKCGKMIYDGLDIKYTGYDTYKKMIDYNSKQHSLPKYFFEHLDFYNEKECIVTGELCILKDVLQHWKINEIYTFLDYLVENKVFKYILICNCCNQTTDDPENDGRSTPLSIHFFPLKKYNPVKLFNYNSKEVSVIYV